MILIELLATLHKVTTYGLILNDKMLGVFRAGDKCPEEYKEMLVDMIVPIGFNKLNIYLKGE